LSQVWVLGGRVRVGVAGGLLDELHVDFVAELGLLDRLLDDLATQHGRVLHDLVAHVAQDVLEAQDCGLAEQDVNLGHRRVNRLLRGTMCNTIIHQHSRETMRA
jgi:hypothetical protein